VAGLTGDPRAAGLAAQQDRRTEGRPAKFDAGGQGGVGRDLQALGGDRAQGAGRVGSGRGPQQATDRRVAQGGECAGAHEPGEQDPEGGDPR
jgi:hypothetical protein